MGDSGSMLVGMMLSAAGTTATTTADPQVFQGAVGTLPTFIGLLIPLSVLALPFIDLLLAVVAAGCAAAGRRLRPTSSTCTTVCSRSDHSHRRAVLLLYFWSALLSVAGIGLAFPHGQTVVLSVLAVLAVFGLLLSLVPRLRRQSAARHRVGEPSTAPTDTARV